MTILPPLPEDTDIARATLDICNRDVQISILTSLRERRHVVLVKAHKTKAITDKTIYVNTSFTDKLDKKIKRFEDTLEKCNKLIEALEKLSDEINLLSLRAANERINKNELT